MAQQLHEVVVTIRLDDRQIEDFIERIRQAVASASPGVTVEQADLLVCRNNEDLLARALKNQTEQSGP